MGTTRLYLRNRRLCRQWVVNLTGSVPLRNQKPAAEQAARSVSRVRYITNEITVEPGCLHARHLAYGLYGTPYKTSFDAILRPST